MDNFICDYCNKKFINKYTLKTHIENSIKCISIRKKERDKIIIEEKELQKSESSNFSLGKITNLNNINTLDTESFIKTEVINKDSVLYKNTKCNYCNKEFYNIYNLERHLHKCYVKNIYVDKNLYENYINKIKLLEKQNNELNIKYNRLEEKYLSLQHNIINNFHYKNIINNNKSNLSIFYDLLPLDDSHIKLSASLLDPSYIVNGIKSLVIFARDHSFKDRVICTDVTRRNFIFKDENNNIIKDPKGVKITKLFLKNNKEELESLLKNYMIKYYRSDQDLNNKLLESRIEKNRDLLELNYAAHAASKGDIVSNALNYNNFEKLFTTYLSKLVYDKKYSIDNYIYNDKIEEELNKIKDE
jgi:hypothetical protein